MNTKEDGKKRKNNLIRCEPKEKIQEKTEEITIGNHSIEAGIK